MHQNRLNFVGVQAFLEIDDMANNDNGQDTYIFHGSNSICDSIKKYSVCVLYFCLIILDCQINS